MSSGCIALLSPSAQNLANNEIQSSFDENEQPENEESAEVGANNDTYKVAQNVHAEIDEDENDDQKENKYGQSVVEKEKDGAESSDGSEDNLKSGKKPRALTEKQIEAEKMKLHSESQRIMRVGALKLPKQISSKSKASLADFVRSDSKFGSFLAKQHSAPAGQISRGKRHLTELKTQPEEPDAAPDDVGESSQENVANTLISAAAKLRAQKLERLLGKPLPELHQKKSEPKKSGVENVESYQQVVNSSGCGEEIVLMKSAKDIQKEKLMERFTQHAQKKKPKPILTRSPLITAASAIDERMLSQMMLQSLEDAKKRSAIEAVVASKDGKVMPGMDASQELPPGRGRHLLRSKLKSCMSDKMRQKHEVRCEMYEQGRREYNERMGIEEGQEGEEKVESDEDFQPDEGQGSDDQAEGDSGSDLGSDVNGEEGVDEDDDEEEERRERNMMIEDEAEEGDEEEDENEDDVTGGKSNQDKRDKLKSLNLVRSNNEMANETGYSDASSFLPNAQMPRSDSNITPLSITNTNTNNNTIALDDSMFPPILYRADSSRTNDGSSSRKSPEGDGDSEYLFSQSNLFDDDGFIRTERSSHQEKSERERENWIKCLLDSSTTNNTSNSANVLAHDTTCDEEVSKLCAASSVNNTSDVNKSMTNFRPSSGENAILDPEDIGFLCSGNFVTQNSQENPADNSTEGSKQAEEKSVFPHMSNSGSNPSSSLDELAMLCSAPFPNNFASQTQPRGAAQASQNSRYQSSPLEDSPAVVNVEGAAAGLNGRLESPAFSAVDPNSPLAGKESFGVNAEYSPSEEPPEGSNIDEDDDEDQILMTARKRPQTPKSAAKKSRKSRVLADSDSEAEEDKVDIEDNECDVMKELAESKVKETSKDELSVFDGGNSVKLFSESAASELGEKQSANRTNQELEKKSDEQESNSTENEENNEFGKNETGRKLRRVVLDDDDDDEDEDADDEGGDEDDDDNDSEGEGEYEDGEAEDGGYYEDEEGALPAEENEELLEYRRAAAGIKVADYMDDQAELSGSDAGEGGSDDEGDYGGLNPNEYEQDGLDDNISVSNAQLRDENGRILLQDMLSEEQRDLKLLQEFLLGDDEEEGMQRIRQFKWKDLDENDGSLLFHSNDDSDDEMDLGGGVSDLLDPNAKAEFMSSMAAALGAVQDISEQSGSKAKARLELSQWLQSEHAAVQMQNHYEKQLQSSQSQLACSNITKLKFKSTSSLIAARSTNIVEDIGANQSVLGGTESTDPKSASNLFSKSTVPAEWNSMPIDHYFKRRGSKLSSEALFRHSSMLKSAAVRLTQLADKMREKSGASKAGGGTQSGLKSSSSVMQPAVDTKNMVFKRKEMPPSDVAGDSRQPADATAKTKNVKRKSMHDSTLTNGTPLMKHAKLDIGTRLRAAKSFILDNLD